MRDIRTNRELISQQEFMYEGYIVNMNDWAINYEVIEEELESFKYFGIAEKE